ncbi:MAG: response regulator [Anaerolineae bacterium]|jgi:signal transduction histidine kinase/FixJ family two-component response regulator|nr:response regulator [Anaerolineae bacterium]
MLKQNETAPLILVADDQLSTAVMLERVFEYEGYRVHKTFDGISTFETIKKILPDLVLLDINMPGITGLDVLKKMREDPKLARIPAIIITAISDSNKVIEGLNLGADDYLRKPFHPQELLARVKSKLKAFHLENELYARTQELESLLRVSEALNLYPENEDLIQFVAHLIQDLIPNQSFQIYQLNHERDMSIPRQYANFTPHNTFPFSDYVQKHIEQAKDLIQWDNMTEFINHHYAITALLTSGHDILGMLVLGADTSYTQNQFRLFNGLSKQIALAFRKSELYQIQQRYALHLEDMVAQRTSELESAQRLLIRTEKLASIGRLAGEIAHEIKNPLMPIRICLDNTKEDIEDGAYQGDMGMIDMAFDSIERINYIVDSLRAFMGNKQVESLQFLPIDINELIEKLTSFNQRILDDIRIITHLSPLPHVLGNRFQLEQVIQNLIINAKDAMPNGGELTIETSHDATHIKIVVMDTGVGIDPSIIGSIFEPFVSTKESGNGLGLFISYGIIQKHNGDIHVKSEVGNGTTFIIQLPTSRNT